MEHCVRCGKPCGRGNKAPTQYFNSPTRYLCDKCANADAEVAEKMARGVTRGVVCLIKPLFRIIKWLILIVLLVGLIGMAINYLQELDFVKSIMGKSTNAESAPTAGQSSEETKVNTGVSPQEKNGGAKDVIDTSK